MDHALQGEHSNKTSTPSMDWSIVSTASLQRQRTLWVLFPSPPTSADVLRFADNPSYQGNVTYGNLSSGLSTSRGF